MPTHSRLVKAVLQRLGLLLGSLLVTWALVEAGYRLLDPFPFIGAEEVNVTEYGNLTQYDPVLGWKGTPNERADLVTENRRVRLVHNSQGFRDVEHGPSDAARPAIVFLGDSFTWGFEVEFEEMFVNLLRARLPGSAIFNLSHRGYGTDQSLLTFKGWKHEGPLETVVLMFDDNDVDDNNSSVRYDKRKPWYEIVGGELVLRGSPSPCNSRG